MNDGSDGSYSMPGFACSRNTVYGYTTDCMGEMPFAPAPTHTPAPVMSASAAQPGSRQQAGRHSLPNPRKYRATAHQGANPLGLKSNAVNQPRCARVCWVWLLAETWWGAGRADMHREWSKALDLCWGQMRHALL